tara:strand:- start:3254 stop:3958 length:705 start_codon:yes stop_codon:yes gene_type:complete
MTKKRWIDNIEDVLLNQRDEIHDGLMTRVASLLADKDAKRKVDGRRKAVLHLGSEITNPDTEQGDYARMQLEEKMLEQLQRGGAFTDVEFDIHQFTSDPDFPPDNIYVAVVTFYPNKLRSYLKRWYRTHARVEYDNENKVLRVSGQGEHLFRKGNNQKVFEFLWKCREDTKVGREGSVHKLKWIALDTEVKGSLKKTSEDAVLDAIRSLRKIFKEKDIPIKLVNDGGYKLVVTT